MAKIMQVNFLRNMLAATVIFTVSVSFSISNAQSKIEKLTSKESSQKATKLPAPSGNSSAPRVTGKLKVHSLGLGLGQTFANSDFGDNGEDKITFDFLYNYSASHSFDLLINFHSHKHEYKNRYVRLTALTAGIKAKLYHFDNFTPFAVAGLGFYSPKVKRVINNALVESESKVVFGTNFGGGGELKLNDKFTAGLLAQYHNPFDVKQEVGPDVEGSYFKLLITGYYHF